MNAFASLPGGSSYIPESIVTGERQKVKKKVTGCWRHFTLQLQELLNAGLQVTSYRDIIKIMWMFPPIRGGILDDAKVNGEGR